MAASKRDTRLADYTKDWNRLRDQKARKAGGVEARTLTGLLFYFSEHYSEYTNFEMRGRSRGEEDKNRLFLVFNLMARAMSRRMGRLWSIDYQYRATPNTRDPEAFDKADVVVDLIRALDYKLDEPTIHWNRLFWMMVGGVVVEHVSWAEDVGREVMPVIDPETGLMLFTDQLSGQEIPEDVKDQHIARGATPERFAPVERAQMTGDVQVDLYSALNCFIDASCRSISHMAGDQAIYLADIRTLGWIKDVFGTDAGKFFKRDKQDLNILKTRMSDRGELASSLTLRDIIPALVGSHSDTDPDMAIVLTRYMPRSASRPSGSRCLFTPDGHIFDETDLESLGYEDVPCRDFHWSPNATTFWSKDFLTDLAPPQKFLNKRLNQLGESANSLIYETLLLGGGLTAKDIPTDLPGVVEDGLGEDGMPRAVPMQRGQLPGWFPETIKVCVEFIDALGGADLLTQRQFPGQLRGPLAIPMLLEILDSEDGPLYRHMGRALADVHQMRLNRVKVYYPPIRTLHYVGMDNRDEVLEFHTDDVLRAGWEFHVTIDPNTLVPELSSLREARIRERLESPLVGLYINPRTNQLDIGKIAHDLKYGDRQREARAVQGRKLARQLIARLWKGEELDPNIPMPFWPHEDMMDELEAEMLTTEWLSASMPVKQQFVLLYEKHRKILGEQQQAQAQAMQSQMMHSAVAQATQQTAAKVASMVTEEAITQIQAQRDLAGLQPPAQHIASILQGQQAQAQPRPRPLPTRRPL